MYFENQTNFFCYSAYSLIIIHKNPYKTKRAIFIALKLISKFNIAKRTYNWCKRRVFIEYVSINQTYIEVIFLLLILLLFAPAIICCLIIDLISVSALVKASFKLTSLETVALIPIVTIARVRITKPFITAPLIRCN